MSGRRNGLRKQVTEANKGLWSLGAGKVMVTFRVGVGSQETSKLPGGRKEGVLSPKSFQGWRS